MTNVSVYERGQRKAAALIADAIHHSLGGGSNQPVTDLYAVLVAAGQHVVVPETGEQRRPR